MKLMSKSKLFANLALFSSAIFYLPANATKNINTQFEYSLKVSVDYSKRDAYLKRTGEKPSEYEKYLMSVKGTVEVADVVDTVRFNKDTYTIRSIANVNGVVGYAFSNQKLIRDSIGKLLPEGYSSLVYQEVRGSTEPFVARVDTKKNEIGFTTNGTLTGKVPVQGRLLDPLIISYLFIGEELPKANFSATFTDGRSLKKYTLVRAEPWDFPYNGQKVRAIRFYKTTSKEDDTTLQVWISEKEHIPLRYIIGLKDEYGVTLQVDLKKIPNLN
jgi:hypothetical protein